MHTTVDTATSLWNEGKKSLDTLLREKAYSDITEKLAENGIDINEVSDEDIETLLADRVKEIRNGIKHFAIGGAMAWVISSMVGV